MSLSTSFLFRSHVFSGGKGGREVGVGSGNTGHLEKRPQVCVSVSVVKGGWAGHVQPIISPAPWETLSQKARVCGCI